MRRILLTTASAAAAMVWAQAAQAQAQTVQDDQQADQATAPKVEDNQIIVLGEKSQRSLQDTTASVVVITPRRIETENIQTLQDVYMRTANVSETYGTAGFTIRGVANRGISGGGDAALATVFVDGAALPANLLQAAPTDMWDVSQVEILRGPQSTLQGLNSLAGAVLIHTTEPGNDWDARARAMYSDIDEVQLSAAMGGPIIKDELAFRVSVDWRQSDGFIWNPTRNTNENPTESTNIRAKLKWTPSALPGFEARIGYTNFDRYGGYQFSYVDTDQPDFFANRLNHSNDPNDSDSNTDLATLDLRYDIGNGFSLNTLTTFNDVREHNRYDNDTTAASDGAYEQFNHFRTWSQELRLNYESDRLTGLIGAFYYKRDQENRTISLVDVPTPVSTITGLLQNNGLDAGTASYIANLYYAALPEIPVNYASDAQGKVETIALFGDGRLALTDQLSVLAGFRYDRETNRLGLEQITTFAGTYPDPAAFAPEGQALYYAIMGINAGVAAIVADASGASAAINQTFEAFLPKIGVEMAWTPDLKTAFTVQRGYRSGGSSTNIARSQTFAYDPEFTWNYELSLRSAWLGGALTVNANAFYVDWTNQQALVNFGLNVFDSHTVNAGKSHLYGFELETAYRASDRFDVYAAVGHTRTQFDEFEVTLGSFTNLSGLEFPYAPHWTLSGGFNAELVDRLTLNVNASHRTAVFGDTSIPQEDARLGARTLVNVRLSYDADHWGAAIFASNLFDEKYIQYTYTGANQAVLGNPRVIGASVELKW